MPEKSPTFRHTPRYEQGKGHGDNKEYRRCETCDAPDAEPYFTTRLNDVVAHGPKKQRNRQPRWRCREHAPRKVVSPLNGNETSTKEYRRRHGIK